MTTTLTAPVVYVPGFIKDPQEAFTTLWNELDWVRHDKVPRREFYFNEFKEPYSYGNPNFARTYLPTLEWHPLVKGIQTQLEAYLNGVRMEVCFLNGYEDGQDQLGWHADDSPEMDDDRPIVTISLGAEREIWFRKNLRFADCHICHAITGEHHLYTCSAEPGMMTEAYAKQCQTTSLEKLLLGNGSMAIMMPGMQDTHEHRIPRSDRHNCGPRISLTFRGYKPA